MSHGVKASEGYLPTRTVKALQTCTVRSCKKREMKDSYLFAAPLSLCFGD